MNYNEMTNFEINCAVARSLGEVFTLPSERKPNPYLFVSNNTVSRLNLDGTRIEKVIVKDWCNSWADAGRIIEENKITLAFDGGEWRADAAACGVDGNEWQIAGESHHNPLRAAMIVFLKLKEPTK